jgi:hypothetical protein
MAISACSGVSAFVRTWSRVTFSHHCISLVKFLNFSVPAVNRADRPVNREEIAFLERLARGPDGLGGIINFQRARAADADLAHLPRHQSRVRTYSAFGGKNAFRGDHSAQIFR